MLLRPYFVSPLLAAAVLASPYKRTDIARTSAHWAGVISLGDAEDTFTDVSSTFYAPAIIGPFSSNASFAIMAGLDDENCPNGYVRVGIDILPDKNDKPSYQAWAMWHPWGQRETFDMSISAGHQIRTSLTRWSKSVFATVENLTTNQTKWTALNPQAGHTICGRDMLIVFAPYQPQVPIANFGEIIFTNGSAASDVLGFPEWHWQRVRLDLEQNGTVTARSPQGHLHIEYIG